MTSMGNNQMQFTSGKTVFQPPLSSDVWCLLNFSLQRQHWYLLQKICLSSGRKQSPHKCYFTRISFNIITSPINHIQFQSCYRIVPQRRNSSHKTGLVNKWLQIMQFISSRGTCKYQAVRSKWTPLVFSDQGLWIPQTSTTCWSAVSSYSINNS